MEPIPVESQTKLQDGTPINHINDLKDYLFEVRNEDFAKGLTKSLISYALGRELTIADDELVNKSYQQFKQSGYKFKSLVSAVILSQEFTHPII